MRSSFPYSSIALDSGCCREPAWSFAISSAAETVAYVTQPEAEEFKAEMWALIGRYTDRLEDPSRRPPGSLPLEILLVTYPLDAVTPTG